MGRVDLYMGHLVLEYGGSCLSPTFHWGVFGHVVMALT